VYLDPTTWGGPSTNPTADTWISAKTPDSNMHDTATNTGKMFRVGGGPSAQYGIVRGLIKFDLAGAPAQSEITNSADSCRVRLNITTGDLTPTDVELHKIVAGTVWDETTTWNQFNNAFEATVLCTTTVAETGWWTFGYNASTAGYGLPTSAGFLLKFASEDKSYYKEFRSRTATATPSIKPYIEIDYGAAGPPPTPTGLANATDFSTLTAGTTTWGAVGSATSAAIAITDGDPVTGPYTIANIASPSYTWTGLTNGVTYHTKVRAKNSYGDSAWSTPVPMTMG